MPSMEVLKELQDLNLADDVTIPPEAVHWTQEQATRYFESGGAEAPTPEAIEPSRVLRWVVDISSWDPTPAEWTLLTGVLTEEESKAAMRFKFVPDQKRALVSRLLQRAACHEAYGVPHRACQLKRTKGSKPYLAKRPSVLPNAPNWNFNVSHEGDYVVLAAEPLLLCGVDVAAPQQARSGRQRTLEEHFETLKAYFTPLEWRTIRSCGPSEAGMEACFRQHWSLKEAFTKARGDGIAFEFCRIEFTMEQAAATMPDGVKLHERASVAVDGVPLPRWRFDIQPLRADHWVSVARGPPRDAIDAWGAFVGTFDAPDPARVAFDEHMARAEPRFVPKTVADLVPKELLDKYHAAAAAARS